jgi:hypothetical protein
MASVLNVPQCPLEQELPVDTHLDTIAEIDAIFNSNRLMLPPLTPPSSQTVELSADRLLDIEEIANQDELKPALLPLSTSTNAKVPPTEIDDKLICQSPVCRIFLLR